LGGNSEEPQVNRMLDVLSPFDAEFRDRISSNGSRSALVIDCGEAFGEKAQHPLIG